MSHHPQSWRRSVWRSMERGRWSNANALATGDTATLGFHTFVALKSTQPYPCIIALSLPFRLCHLTRF